jgi:hypothetical protein
MEHYELNPEKLSKKKYNSTLNNNDFIDHEMNNLDD